MAENEAVPVQAVLGAAGACPQIRFGGKTYRLGHPTQAAKARLEELAADAAVRRVEAMEGRVKPQTLRRMLERVTDRVVAGEFRTWGPGWQEVVWGDGGTLFALSLFQEHHPEMAAEDVAALLEKCGLQYKAALARVLPFFFDLLLSGREDVTPDQRQAVRAELGKFLAALAPEPTPPDSPTPATTAT